MLVACTADFEDVKVSNTPTLSDKIINGSTDCNKGTLLVRFTPSAESRLAECATRSGATRTGVEGVDNLLDEVNGYSVEPIFVVTEKNREKVYRHGLHLWYTLHFDEGCDIDKLASSLAEVAEVQVVQFSHNISRIGSPKLATKAETRAVATPSETAPIAGLPFDDVYRSYQWGLNHLGYGSKVKKTEKYISNLPSVVEGADINIKQAWKLCTGDPSVVVAVMDEAVMYTHEDLKDNMWTNTAELNGADGVDDDKNGFIDDVHGYNFVFWGQLTYPLTWDKKGDTGHGTHVAGIVSAVNNNRVGVCGIAGGSGKKDGVKIQSLQIFQGNGGAKSSGVARGMQYAADNGAHILQCSWGYISAAAAGYRPQDLGPSNDISYRNYYGVEKDAIDYFIANAGTDDANSPIKGGVVVFAAGNEEASLPSYPAAYEPCIAVAAFSPSLRPAYYTNYGTGTDIIAPGGELLYDNGGILSTIPSVFAESDDFENYGWMQGTSQACPHVSGVAALGLSYAKKLGKSFTASEFRSMILSATNDIEPHLTGRIYSSVNGIDMNYPDFCGKLGSGYIDAYKMLLQVEGTPYSVVKCGASTIDLATYFGEGVFNAQLSQIVISDEDREAIGLNDCVFNQGKLEFNCSKQGAATVSITLLVGGGSLNDSSKPLPTKVTKKFVVIVRNNVAANGGWL